MLKALSPEIAADRRADRNAYLLAAVMTLTSLAIQTYTRADDASRAQLAIGAGEIFLQEATSHLAIICLLPLFPFLMNRAPLFPPTRATIALYLGGVAAFSTLHVSIMYALRLLLFPPLIGKAYEVNLLRPDNFFYEFQKDSFTYVLLLFAFVVFRALGKQKLEMDAAKAAARKDHKVTLTSGGSSFIVNAADILSAQAAGNYVEVQTATNRFLARMTISALETLLAEAGENHVRTHRSYLVNRDAITQVTPAANGGVDILLSTGNTVPGSRRYRGNLNPG